MPDITYQNILLFVVIYIMIGVINYGRLHNKYGSDGPDGLIPLVGSVFWLPVLPFVLLFMILKGLFAVGQSLSSHRKD